MKVLKGAALALATLLFCLVAYEALVAKQFLIASPMAILFLVLAYLGADLKVKSFSFDADDKKISVNEGAKHDPKN